MNRRRIHSILLFLVPYRMRLVGIVGITMVISVLSMSPPLIVRAVLDRVIEGGVHELLVPLGVVLLLVPVLNGLCGFIQVVGVAYVGQKFVVDIRDAVFRRLLALSPRFFAKESAGKLSNRLLTDSTNVQQMLTGQSVQVFSDLFCAIFGISVSFLINWRLSCLLVVVVGMFVLNYKLNISRIRKATRGYRGADDRLAGGLQNRLTTDLTVKTYGTEQREHSEFVADSRTSLDLVRETQLAMNTFSMNTMLLRDLGRATIYFIGCAMVLKGSASYGDVAAFTSYAVQLLMPAVRFSQLARQLQDVGVSIDRLLELMEEREEIPVNASAPKLDRVAGSVDFQKVGFHYEPGVPVLRDFDLSVKPGQTVALVGPTGCGKSTILSLLLRFFDVTRGRILVDGRDVRDINVVSLRRQFGIVLQEPLLFGISLADNIRYSAGNASTEEVKAAARIAEIHDVIEALPDGYESRVGGRHGVTLSVGEKQRVSIARAVLADPAILIMDEATSSLDSNSEKAIQIALDRFLKGRTSFVVAHRLSTIRNADRIVLLRDGRILETGSHDELMLLNNGTYRSLYEKHMGAGVLDNE